MKSDRILISLAGPVLLDCSETAQGTDVNWRCLPEHRDEEQVQRDVDRAFVYYPNSTVFYVCPCTRLTVIR